MIKGNKREKENGVVGKKIKAIGTMWDLISLHRCKGAIVWSGGEDGEHG
jgi:hypothetical protein